MLQHIRPGFDRLLEPFDADNLEQHASSVVAIDDRGLIAYVNPAYFHFASENNGMPAIEREWGLNTNLLQAVPPSMRAFYRNLFNQARTQSPRGLKPLQHCYECSSPDLFRKFQMTAYSLGHGEGVLCVHSLLVEEPHDSDARPSVDAGRQAYRDDRGMIRQCMCCRRTQHPRHSQRWDWVPRLVEEMPEETTHGVCPICIKLYFAHIGIDMSNLPVNLPTE